MSYDLPTVCPRGIARNLFELYKSGIRELSTQKFNEITEYHVNSDAQLKFIKDYLAVKGIILSISGYIVTLSPKEVNNDCESNTRPKDTCIPKEI